MDRIIACCGIECSKCDAYVATKNNDDVLRKTTAENWSKMFNANLEAKENCSKCNDYTCDRIDGFFKMVPDAKNVLDSLRQNK